MPGFDYKVWVKDGVHLNDDVGGNGDDRGKVKDPAEEVKGAGEEANHAAIAGTGGHGGPVVDAASRGDCRCQLEVVSGKERKGEM